MLLNIVMLVSSLLGIIAAGITIQRRWQVDRNYAERRSLWVILVLFGILLFASLLRLIAVESENESLRSARLSAQPIADRYDARSIDFLNEAQMGEVIGTAILVSAQLGDCYGAYSSSLAKQFEELAPPAPILDDYAGYVARRDQFESLAGMAIAFVEGVAEGRVQAC